MPRTARLDAPGTLHHVIVRGLEGREIFRDGEDREDFLERIAKLLPGTRCRCYAWALMPNHAHLLVRSGAGALSQFMGRLLTGHAVRFNRRHGRQGRLFQNRYKSIVCQQDAYFKELVRYIHLNPLRAGMVRDVAQLGGFAYTGHSALLGRRPRDWMDTGTVLAMFGSSQAIARRRYAAFVEAGAHHGSRPELSAGKMVLSHSGWRPVATPAVSGHRRDQGDERILGDRDFVAATLAAAKEKLDRRVELLQRGCTLQTVEQRVMEVLGIGREQLYAPGRRKLQVRARSLLCYWAVCELGVTAAEMARRLGMTPPAVGYAVRRGERIARENGYRMTGW